MKILRRPCPPTGEWPASVPEVLRRVYAARGILHAADADLALSGLLPPDSLGQLASAVALLAEAIAHDRHIVVVGDFDCDGATGTAVAVRGLRLLGARRVSYRVPHRAIHGYGLSPALVDDLATTAPDLLLTVDSGVACLAGVAAARARGWQVLVTDHHLPGPELPAANAMVNPNLDGDGFPSKALAGVGVVFYLLAALRRHLRDAGTLGVREPDLSSLLDWWRWVPWPTWCHWTRTIAGWWPPGCGACDRVAASQAWRRWPNSPVGRSIAWWPRTSDSASPRA